MFDNVSLVLHNCFVGIYALGVNLVIVFNECQNVCTMRIHWVKSLNYPIILRLPL